MTKEEILSDLKEIILATRDDKERLLKDSSFMQNWMAKENAIQAAFKNLNSCDRLWITDQYAKFHKAEIAPNIPKDLPKIPDQP